jgi:hypothetical protein
MNIHTTPHHAACHPSSYLYPQISHLQQKVARNPTATTPAAGKEQRLYLFSFPFLTKIQLNDAMPLAIYLQVQIPLLPTGTARKPISKTRCLENPNVNLQAPYLPDVNNHLNAPQ